MRSLFLLVNFAAQSFAAFSTTFEAPNPLTGEHIAVPLDTLREKQLLTEYAAPLVMGGMAIVSLNMLVFGEQGSKTGWSSLLLSHSFITVMLAKSVAASKPHFFVADPLPGAAYHGVVSSENSLGHMGE